MKAWSRAQANQEREANLYHHHQAEAELIHSYLHSQQHQQAVQAAVAAASTTSTAEQGAPYGVPIPPPLVPSPGEQYVVDDHCRGGDHRDEHSPLPPPRSSSSGQGRSRGKRSRHTGASSSGGHQHHEGGGSRGGRQQQESQVTDIHYPKYELYGQYKYSGSREQQGGGDCQYQTKYGEDCRYSSEQQHQSSRSQHQGSSSKGGGECQYTKSWPKQHYTDEQGACPQDDPHVQYLQDLEAAEAAQLYEEQQHQQQQHQRDARHNKKRSKESQQYQDKRQYREQRSTRDKSPCQQDYPTLSARDREYLVSTVGAKQHLVQQQQQQLEVEHQQIASSGSAQPSSTLQQQAAAASKAAADPIPAIEEVGRYIEEAKSQKSVKELTKDIAKEKGILPASSASTQQSTASTAEQLYNKAAGTSNPEIPTTTAKTVTVNMDHTLQTFNPDPQRLKHPDVQLQQEQIQYVDNECCQVAVTPSATASATLMHQEQTATMAAGSSSTMKKTATLGRVTGTGAASTATMGKTGTLPASHQFGTLERNMAEVAERNRKSQEDLLRSNATLGRDATLGRYATASRVAGPGAVGDSCDTCDAPLTPASLAGIDHRDLEHRPLTRSVTRATVYDEPPEKTSLFITCSGIYGLILVVVCIAFLSAEVVTHHVPLHYFEGLFTYLYITSILFLLYVFCYVLHEYSCCGGPPQGTSGRNTYFQNLPRDALPDGSPIREKLATFKRPRKFKTSENDFSHGSFFLRIGGITFGLGTMIYNGLELGTFFEIPWNSPCYQVLRGINPILQMIFTFSQMYFVFMNARLNIHKFKCVARFGLVHIVATNICVWIRTMFKESNKDIAIYRVNRGQGVSEDYMILEGYNNLRQKFGPDSFWVNGPYHAIMAAINGPGEGSYFSFNIFNTNPESSTMANMLPTPQSLIQQSSNQQQLLQTAQQQLQDSSSFMHSQPALAVLPDFGYRNEHQQSYQQGIIKLANNFTCGRTAIMGDIFKFSGPYLYPFVIEYSLIAAAVMFAMWKNIGNNPRYHGEEDDRISVASRKMTAYAKTDCIGASKGLFFGLLTLVCGMICLILFFVLIGHNNQQVSQLAIFLADLSHCAILIVCILATLLGFIRVQKMKFHGEDQSFLGETLLRFASCGILAYSTFNIVAGGLGVHTDLKNLLVFATGAITIIQVFLQLLFITDAQRRRIHSSSHDSTKPGRQVVTFLLICNFTMWIIYTFEVQKVEDSPIQKQFFGFYAWSIIQRVTLPLCIFFRFHSTVILVEVWKNSYKTKLMD